MVGDHCVYLSVNTTAVNETADVMCSDLGASFYVPETRAELDDLMTKLANGMSSFV